MLRSRAFVSAFFIVLFVAMSAEAAEVVDQSQPLFTEASPVAVGGASHQILAQTITAGLTGPLTAIEIPISCSSGTLVLEIVELDGDLPSSRVIASAEVDASALPLPADFRRIELDHSVFMVSSQRYAFVLRNATGQCTVKDAPEGDVYSRGDLYYQVDENPAGWIAWHTYDAMYDLPFKTYVEVGGSGPPHREPRQCNIIGFPPAGPGAPPSRPIIPEWVPVCRCLQDPSIREGRCGLLHASIVAFRRIPDPIPAGQPFKVQWTVMPLAKLTGTVSLRDVLPAGFQSFLQGRLVFPLGQIPPGGTMTLEYTAIAGQKDGEFKIDSEILIAPANQSPSEGGIRSIIEVGKLK